jgi:hypothetical protein
MNRHEISSNELDKIGRKLIASTSLSESEIERIAESPFLYSGVKTRIVSEVPLSKRGFGFRQLALGLGSLLVMAGMATVSLMVFRSEGTVISKRSAPVQKPRTEQPVQDSLAQVSTADTEVAPAIISEKRNSSPQFQNASFGRTEDRASTRRMPARERKPDLEFYPLTFAGDPVETTSGGRVMQVELSRSSLFAMGFNIPIENGAELVKADLLVGPDGVARAIRLH